jgi:ketopantoate reductase
MKNILLVGCGNVGFRYLQAINKLDLSFKCIVIEKNNLLRQKIRKKFNFNFKFFNSIPKNFTNYDLCIVSTQAKDRYKAIVTLWNKINCKNWILEKNLGISSKEIYEIKKLLQNYNVWINTPLRIFQVYKYLKKKEQGAHKFKILWKKLVFNI